ncbi:MAG: ATP synthase F1 subunit epsilon, partial [Actinobacteria bacterium]
MVVARTSSGGDIAFLTGHVPFLGVLEPGLVRVIEEDGTELRVAVFGGFIEVNHDRVSILSDAAELANVIDVEAARRARDEAQAILRQGADDEAEAALRMAEVRLLAAGVAPATGPAAH